MTFDKFVEAVNNLVRSWKDDGSRASIRARHKALRAIFDDAREEVVKECADFIEQSKPKTIEDERIRHDDSER
jgi:hypothetical protein